ncbi:MAG: 4Fe-4S binding protein [Candidatus Diapherotrites archaeon]|nr:4Fe-4S binding protein [Candidatus Diapherotrites archaeon]
MVKVKVDAKKCDGCGTCVNVCPVNVYELKSKKAVPVREKDCIECRACEVSCPKKAITIE